MKKLKLLCLFAITFYNLNVQSQLDSIHWVPPLHAGLNGQIDDHYLYLSTPNTTPFSVTITDGAGTILATPTISNSSPFSYFVGNGQTSGSPLFIPRSQLNNILPNRGIKLFASQEFFVSLRVRSNNQADWAVSKGLAGIGKTFHFGGFPQFNSGPPASVGGPSNRNFTMGIIATQNNTTISISNYDPSIVLDGVPLIPAPPPFSITLNEGESYVIAGGSQFIANQNGFIGALIESDKPIALNNGNMNGTIHPTNTTNQDMGIDLSIPVERLGKEYVFVQGNGNSEMERPIIIASQNNTNIFINGNTTPIANIDAGDYFLIPNSNYQGVSHRNMFVSASKPIYAYQALAATTADNDGGLVLLPPFNCFLPNSIDLIPVIDSIGSTQYETSLLITTELGASVSINGTPLSGAEPVVGGNWQTYKTNSLVGNTEITSTGGLTVSVLGNDSPAGFAGYFSGFSTTPLPSDFSYLDTCYNSGTSFTATFDEQVLPDSISWNFGDPTSNDNTTNGINVHHQFSEPGTYTIQMILFRCINDTITKNITILPSSIDTTSTTICQGDSIFINNNFYFEAGQYYDTLTNIYGCDSILMTNLTVIPSPTISQNFTECEGFSVVVGNNEYTTSGLYLDTLTATSGCDSIVTTELNITSPPSIMITKEDDNCGNEVGSVEVDVTSNFPPVNYFWSTGDTSPYVDNLSKGTYNLIVTDANGCETTDNVTINNIDTDCNGSITIPNVFTPNGDGSNDEFIINLKGLEFIKLSILNRWGNTVFETEDKNEGWNGLTTGGKEATDGTYFYLLEYNQNNEHKSEHGFLTLIRN